MSKADEKRLEKELAETKAVLNDLLQERGAMPETLRTVETLQGSDEDAKRKVAEGILWRIYRNWVDREVDDLVRAVIDNEVDDWESLEQRMEESTDGSLIYTHDQRMVLFVSESVNEGEERMEEMGGGGDNAALLALLTYQADVLGRMGNIGLDYDFDRDAWLEAARAGEYGEEIAVLAKED